jgi:hypothetical protein
LDDGGFVIGSIHRMLLVLGQDWIAVLFQQKIGFDRRAA